MEKDMITDELKRICPNFYSILAQFIISAACIFFFMAITLNGAVKSIPPVSLILFGLGMGWLGRAMTELRFYLSIKKILKKHDESIHLTGDSLGDSSDSRQA